MVQPDEARSPAWKVILVGEEGVGKTSLYRRIDKHDFFPNLKSTIGIDYCTVPVQVGGRECRLDLWDTGGSEKHQSMTMSYYRKSCAIFFLFSRDSSNSLLNLEHWVQDARLFAPSALFFLVACKQDKVGELVDPVEDEMVREWVAEQETTGSKFQRPVPFVTSAKTNEGVQLLLDTVCGMLLQRMNQAQALFQAGGVSGDNDVIVGMASPDNLPSSEDGEEKKPSHRCCTLL